jgi:hypothetical protein
MKSLHTSLILVSILASSRATAALIGFEAVDGYTVNSIKVDGVTVEAAGLSGAIGPDSHLYSAGSGSAIHKDIADNSGSFRNIYGAGTNGSFFGGSADTTYLSAHQSLQSASSVRPPSYDAGAQVLAFRTDARPFGDPVDGPHDAKYAYRVDSLDLNGVGPNAVGNKIVTIDFVTCVSILQTIDGGTLLADGTRSGTILSTFDNPGFIGLEMGFGGVGGVVGDLPGTASGEAARIGWTDENNLAYFNGTGWVDTGFLFNYKGYDSVSVSIDTGADTWSLAINRSLNSTAYARETVFTNQPLLSAIGTSFGDISFRANEDPDTGIDPATSINTANGLSKTYFDNFAFTVVPEPSSALLGLIGCLGLLRRRR